MADFIFGVAATLSVQMLMVGFLIWRAPLGYETPGIGFRYGEPE